MHVTELVLSKYKHVPSISWISFVAGVLYRLKKVIISDS
jgi:hypothetical protein